MLDFSDPRIRKAPKPPLKEWKFEGENLEECEEKAQAFIYDYALRGNDVSTIFCYQTYEDFQKKEAYIIIKEKEVL